MLNFKISFLAATLIMLSMMGIANNALAVNTAPSNNEPSEVKLPSNSNIMVYINPVFYEHPVRMLHPYLDVWHLRGDMVEKIALKALNSNIANSQANAQTCQPNVDANFTISLEPYMFYNPQMRVFHAEVLAKVYAGKLDAIASFKAKAQQQGELNNAADYYFKQAYAKAMQDIVKQLNSEMATHPVASNSLENNLCTLLATVPVTKKYFN